jgi:tetratricopeptide (TPR) repeat protein
MEEGLSPRRNRFDEWAAIRLRIFADFRLFAICMLRSVCGCSSSKRVRTGQAAQSLAYFDSAIAEDPTYYRAYHNLGIAYLRLGRIQEAERAFQKAIDLTGGGYAPADFAMGLALSQDEDYRRAETVIQRGLEIDPGSATGKFSLAMAQFALNRLAEAERSAEQALWRNRDFPEAYFLMAAIHEREHNSPAVAQDLAEYLRLEANGEWSDKARSPLAKTQLEMNQTQAAAGPAKP